jgi:hypothetical protein
MNRTSCVVEQPSAAAARRTSYSLASTASRASASKGWIVLVSFRCRRSADFDSENPKFRRDDFGRFNGTEANRQQQPNAKNGYLTIRLLASAFSGKCCDPGRRMDNLDRCFNLVAMLSARTSVARTTHKTLFQQQRFGQPTGMHFRTGNQNRGRQFGRESDERIALSRVQCRRRFVELRRGRFDRPQDPVGVGIRTTRYRSSS